MNKFQLNTLLECKEKRDNFEQKILQEDKNKTLITIKANYPGPNKNTYQAHLISYEAFRSVKKNIRSCKIFHSRTEEGLIFFVLTEETGLDVKRKTIGLEENSFLGRFFDIDVKTNLKLFSRKDLSMLERKCFLCEKKAVICSRSRAHSLSDLLNHMETRLKDFFHLENNTSKTLARLVRVAMLEELSREYSFGCVNANTNGAHNDMDFLLMLKGIESVCESIENLSRAETNSFNSLREYGIGYEKKLFTNCTNINTYKGAHFLLLILVASVMQVKNFSELSNFIKKFSAPLRQDFEMLSKKNLSHFQLGIRNEPLSGFKNHFEFFLPLLENGASYTDLTCNIFAHTYDTTTIKRSSIEELKKLQTLAKNATTIEKQIALDKYCNEKLISTGGVADNFIITIMLLLLKKYFYTN